MPFSPSSSGTSVRSVRPDVTINLLTPKRVWIESPLKKDELVVYWSPRNYQTNRYPIGFNVYRGMHPHIVPTLDSQEVVKLTSTPVVVPFYKDTTVDTKAAAHWYYLVSQVFTDGSETPLDEPVCLGTQFGGVIRKNLSPLHIYREFKRRKLIILERTGETVDILVRRRAGTRCDCYNGEYESFSKSNCPQCYGTGWDRGYEILRDITCRVISSTEVLRMQSSGLEFSANPRGWLVDYPMMRNGDILVRRDGQRYEVNRVDPMIHQGILTEQGFELVNLPETHPVYGYDIPLSDAA